MSCWVCVFKRIIAHININLVIEEVNVSISGDKRPTSVQGPAMFQTIVNYAMREYNINEMQAMVLLVELKQYLCQV
jgi:hypothetical protein